MKHNLTQYMCLCTSINKYQPTEDRLKQIQESPSGWVPPADPRPDFPFQIRRSRTNNLPVYTDYKTGRTRIITQVRKVSGDLKALEDCLRLKLGDDVSYQINELTSSVKIKGHHKKEITKWLLELGF
eukprot:gene19993-21953_t